MSHRRGKFCWLAAKWWPAWWRFGFSTDHLGGQCVLSVAYSDKNFPYRREKPNDFAPKLAVHKTDLELNILLKSTRISTWILTNFRHFYCLLRRLGLFCFHSVKKSDSGRLFPTPKLISKRLGPQNSGYCWIKELTYFTYGWLLHAFNISLWGIGRNFFKIRETFSKSWKTCKSIAKIRNWAGSMGNKNRLVSSCCIVYRNLVEDGSFTWL